MTTPDFKQVPPLRFCLALSPVRQARKISDQCLMLSGNNTCRLQITNDQEDPEWDAFVVGSVDPHPEQTSLWGDVQRLCGWRPLRLIARRGSTIVGGVQLLERPLRQIGKVGYINRGPLLAADDPILANQLLNGLMRVGRQRRMIYLAVVLPYSGQFIEAALIHHGFALRPDTLPPTTPMMSTMVLDLKQDLDEILMGLRPSTRQNVRKAQKRGLSFREGTAEDLDTFNDLLLELCKRRRVETNVPQGPFLKELWKVMASKGYLKIFLTEHGSEPIGALLLFTMGGWARLWRIGWSGRYAAAYPNELIHWETIRWARQNGYRYFDFVGFDTKYAKAIVEGRSLPADEACKISFFKQGFGGRVLTLQPHYCYFFNPVVRWIFASGGGDMLNHRLFKRMVNAFVPGKLSHSQ